jgi:hypothetical protein
MTFSMDCVKYWIYLKEKGWFDESFYIEYDFICHELINQNYPELKAQSDNLQTEVFLH